MTVSRNGAEWHGSARTFMKVSAVIPTYNSAATIRATLESVQAQTEPADEILVLDDGSTDGTVRILESFQPKITVFQQPNKGVAHARNALCTRATGDLIAFLDHDDLWHPDYLKYQRKLFVKHPHAVVFFTGHATVYGSGGCPQWEPVAGVDQVEEILPVDFVKRYHKAIGAFMSMSFCSIPKTVLQRLGDQPFCEEVSGVDDCYLFHQLALLGRIVYCPSVLAAYRITSTAQSSDRIRGAGLSVRAMELLGRHYHGAQDYKMRATFQWALAAQRREYGKVLMSGRRSLEARKQFWLAAKSDWHLVSVAKSARLLLYSCLPLSLQPRWLPTQTIMRAAELI